MKQFFKMTQSNDSHFTIYDLFRRIPPKIIGGDEYYFDAFGDKARYLDLECNVDIIFDEESGRVYQLAIRDEDEANDIWIDPEYEDAYIEELIEKRGKSGELLKERVSTTNDTEDIIEKILKLYPPIVKRKPVVNRPVTF